MEQKAARSNTTARALQEHPASEGPDVVVTGISRSGTSYLCNLLDRLGNCVVLNEPAEIISLLASEEIPWSLPRFYRARRRDVIEGRPLENKVRNGEVVEDTAVYEKRHEYRPYVSSPDFVLAVKNTREFLLRLDEVRRVLPSARVIACVRDPFDTIASWKESFRHLRDVDVSPFLGHPSGFWLPTRQRLALERIAETHEAAQRRALWWRFQAERVVEHLDDLLLVDYLDLVTEPRRVLVRVLSGYDAGKARRAITPSRPRSRRYVLDDDDRAAIEAVCLDVAAELRLRGAWMSRSGKRP